MTEDVHLDQDEIATARGLIGPDLSPEPATNPSGPLAASIKRGLPDAAVTDAIPEICAVLPAVGGSLLWACEQVGVKYRTVYRRQKQDPDLRRTLMDAGWRPYKPLLSGRAYVRSSVRRERIGAALETVLAQVSDGVTLTLAADRAGIASTTVRQHRDHDPEFRERLAEARTPSGAA